MCRLIPPLALLACAAFGADKLPLPELEPTQKQELVQYLTSHWQSPEEYIIGKFATHDIVFLGEGHRIKHDPVLIQNLIPLLYESGVHNLGFEFTVNGGS